MKKSKDDLKEESLYYILINILLRLYVLHDAKSEKECQDVLDIYRQKTTDLGLSIFKMKLKDVIAIANDNEHIEELANEMYHSANKTMPILQISLPS